MVKLSEMVSSFEELIGRQPTDDELLRLSHMFKNNINGSFVFSDTVTTMISVKSRRKFKFPLLKNGVLVTSSGPNYTLYDDIYVKHFDISTKKLNGVPFIQGTIAHIIGRDWRNNTTTIYNEIKGEELRMGSVDLMYHLLLEHKGAARRVWARFDWVKVLDTTHDNEATARQKL